MKATVWKPTLLAELKLGDLVRAESQSSHKPHIAFEGRVTGRGDNMRIELDLISPLVSYLDASSYIFHVAVEADEA